MMRGQGIGDIPPRRMAGGKRLRMTLVPVPFSEDLIETMGTEAALDLRRLCGRRVRLGCEELATPANN